MTGNDLLCHIGIASLIVVAYLAVSVMFWRIKKKEKELKNRENPLDKC